MSGARLRGRARPHGASGGTVAPPPRRPVQPTRKGVGIQDLPTELFGEILSHFPPIRFEMVKPSQEDLEFVANRRATLIALSQTCFYFRSLFLPKAYDSIQVFTGFNMGKGQYLPDFDPKVPGRARRAHAEYLFAKQFLDQIQVVTVRNRNLGQYVKSLDVTILGYEPLSIIQELLRCIKRLPNLVNVYLNIADSPPSLRDLLYCFRLHQVHTLRVSEGAQKLIHCFPNLRHLGRAGDEFVGIDYWEYYGRLRNLEIMTIPSRHYYNMAEIALHMPNLHKVTLNHGTSLLYLNKHGKEKFWGGLAKLQCLQVITVKGMPENLWRSPQDPVLDIVMNDWVVPALETLRSTEGGIGGRKQKKKLVLRWGKKTRIFLVPE